MIEYAGSFGNGDNYNILCDSCSNYEKFEEIFNFKKLIEEAKDNGWIMILNKKGEWEHFCSNECLKEKEGE